MTTRRQALTIFAAAAAGAAIAACGGAATAPVGPAVAGGAPPRWTMEKARVSASTTSVNHLWAQWGVKQGFYRKHFLDVEVIDNIADAPAALAAGQVDFIATGGGTISGAVRGLPIRSQMLTAQDNYALMVNRSITSLEQLKGKTIIGPNDVMKAALLAKGIDPETITWAQSRGTTSQNIELVNKGEAVGLAGFPPLEYIAEDAGLRRLLITADVFPGAPVSNTATHLDTMTKRPDYVRRLIAANLETLRHMRDNKALVIEFMNTDWKQTGSMSERAFTNMLKDHYPNGKTESAVLQRLVDIVARAQKSPTTLWSDVYSFTHLDAVLASPGTY